jgi:hypothetical protein
LPSKRQVRLLLSRRWPRGHTDVGLAPDGGYTPLTVAALKGDVTPLRPLPLSLRPLPQQCVKL